MSSLYKVIFLALIILPANIFAQVFSGTTAGQFLKIEVGAKALGMGGAFVSIADDVSSIYWNPAGISRLKNNSASFSHTFWLADINHDFAAAVLKINETHSFGLSYTSVKTDDMKVRTEIYPEGTGEFFTASDYSIALTYGLNLTDNFSCGITGKIVGQSIWHMDASTVALDVGLIYTTPVENLQLGMAITNIGGKIQYSGKDNFIYYDFDETEHGNSSEIFANIQMDQWDLPVIFRAGLSYKLDLSQYHSFLLSVDAVHPSDYSEYINAGFQYTFYEKLFIRAGYKSLFKEDSEEGLSAGIGLLYYLTYLTPLRIDYSYNDFGKLKSVQRISIELGF